MEQISNGGFDPSEHLLGLPPGHGEKAKNLKEVKYNEFWFTHICFYLVFGKIEILQGLTKVLTKFMKVFISNWMRFSSLKRVCVLRRYDLRPEYARISHQFDAPLKYLNWNQ